MLGLGSAVSADSGLSHRHPPRAVAEGRRGVLAVVALLEERPAGNVPPGHQQRLAPLVARAAVDVDAARRFRQPAVQ